MTNTAPSLEEFLSLIVGAKEPSLIIAHNGDEQEQLVIELEHTGFVVPKGIEDIVNHKKSYVALTVPPSKNFYDVLAQYATGQVEVFDSSTMESHTFTPNYHQTALVVLTTKEILAQCANEGMDFRPFMGLTYQS